MRGKIRQKGDLIAIFKDTEDSFREEGINLFFRPNFTRKGA